jgi:hypothetical protein
MKRFAMILLVAGCLTVAGCGSSREAATDTTTGSGSSSSTPSSSAEPSPPRCHTSQLQAAVRSGQGAAGSMYTPLSLTNTGTASCQMTGYPGVSLLDVSGNQIGSPATHSAATVAAITLAPGDAAHTVMRTQNPTGGNPCDPVSTSVKVFPPDELDALTVPGALQTCGGDFTITPMVAGTTE